MREETISRTAAYSLGMISIAVAIIGWNKLDGH